ncbi:MAG: HD domain-containing phosphohydrolase [Phycisphaerales bacterium]
MSAVATPTVPGPIAQLRARLREAGLPTWRCDCAGRVLAEPEHAGAVGLLLRARPMTRMVSLTVEEWARQEGVAEPAEIAPGCWLVPLEERVRRERVGFVAALALSPESLRDEWFMSACVAAQVDVPSTQAACAAIARFDGASARAIAGLLGSMRDDLARSVEDQETIAGFTRQLTDGFEIIDLLYALGRSMHDVARPQQFVDLVCDRLHGSMAFGWLAAVFTHDAKAAKLLGQEMTVRGTSVIGEAKLRALLPGLVGQVATRAKPTVLSTLGGEPLPGHTQVLLQPVMRAGRVAGVLLVGEKGGDDPQVSSYDIHLLEAAAGYMGAFMDNAVLYADQQAMFMGTLRAMTAAIDAKDRYTCGHSERVAMLSKQLALAAGLGPEVAERLHICGIVHDVGKIGVPEQVLGKPGRLTDEEFGQIKMHPEIGHTILRDIPLLEDILPGVMHHHERYDGKGYPAGLVGADIPLFARIIALADTFDAMSSTRSYRSAMPREKVLAEFARCAGSQFDPVLAAAFLTVDLAPYDAMVAKHRAAEIGLRNPVPAAGEAAEPLRKAA